MVGRAINPQEAGSLNLGITYFTIVMALSTWGLHELLVREAFYFASLIQRTLNPWSFMPVVLFIQVYEPPTYQKYVVVPE